ncbi:hypothetical protein F0562_026550 [Nyssa sinensis]|uniref:DUF4378 domain-containing protein n=1 Tax=Nyssa sinensis TaxID=561372 RepID=A0A5J5BB68_9ASTE|nr:hypothetical protein F0562_026550 [Nyssa sinensis]
MGKEWLYWGNGASRSTKRGRSQERDTSTPGCMCAVLQLFDFHQFQFSLHQQPSFKPESFLPEEPTILKGVEAPRNSLELEEAILGATSLSSTMKEGENLSIQMGIKVKTRGDNSRSSLECGSSPGAKTPNLVARLMGLDQLVPESSSPSFSSSSSHHSTSNHLSKSHLHPTRMANLNQDYFQSRQLLQSQSSRSTRSRLDTDIMATRSLPETPRISLARRSDVDHRLSLQINKENIAVREEFEFTSYLTARTTRKRELIKQEDENRSPNNYARQIVKQVKESVSRKVGIDITNTEKNREREHVVQLKSKKLSKGDELSPSKQSTQSSCSPRLKFLEPKSKPVTTPANKNQNFQSPKLSSSVSKQSQPAKVSAKLKTQPLQEEQQPQQNHNSTQKCKKAVSEHFSKKPPRTSDAMRNKQEEAFVRSPSTNRANISDKKSKKTPLSNELLNINVPTLLSVKKDPSPSTTKLPTKQLSICSSKQEATHRLTVQDDSNNNRSDGANTDGVELQYIARIMNRTSIDRNSPVSFTNWYSPSHPLDPSIFHHLELSTTTTTNSQLNRRCNRKLLFQLVDEILAELLTPYINLKPWITSMTTDYKMSGSQLIDTLWAKIRSFPAADCQVLEDIDRLIDADLCKNQVSLRAVAFEEEAEGIVAEIELDIVESLVHETAMEMFDVATANSI